MESRAGIKLYNHVDWEYLIDKYITDNPIFACYINNLKLLKLVLDAYPTGITEGRHRTVVGISSNLMRTDEPYTYLKNKPVTINYVLHNLSKSFVCDHPRTHIFI